MNDALCPVITTTGWQALLNAQTHGLDPVSITEVALGDQGYEVPINDQGQATPTALQGEQQRTSVLSSQVDGQQLSLHFMLDGPQSYWVRELGFYLTDGTLFALWSHPNQALAWKSDSVPLLLALEVVLASLPAHSVTVQTHGTPLELIMTREMATIGTALANVQLEQLRQADQIKTLRGGFK